MTDTADNHRLLRCGSPARALLRYPLLPPLLRHAIGRHAADPRGGPPGVRRRIHSRSIAIFRFCKKGIPSSYNLHHSCFMLLFLRICSFLSLL